ncbi:MAG: hypothetical protein GY926_13660 [bacterium]|nr:hypothetical protein [bacterium]
MDFCFSCGSKTDPDWVFCRSCGHGLDETEELVEPVADSTGSGSPKVELISRGWDEVVDIETVELPTELLDEDEIAFPVPAGGMEVTVDSITVIEEPEPAAEPVASDPWDHLRPRGEMPRIQNRPGAAARTAQVALATVAFSGLVAAGLRFYLNTRIDAFGKGEATAQEVEDVTLVADIGLLIMAALAIIAVVMLAWWYIKARATSRFRLAPADWLALAVLVAGIGLVTTFVLLDRQTVAADLAANSLVVLGLGLLVASSAAAIRTVGRMDLGKPE